MKYQVFVNRKKVSIELKISSLMSWKMFSFFTRIFRYSWCRMPQVIYRTSIFFVNFSENHRIFPGDSMGKIIGRGMPNILLFFYMTKVSHYWGSRDWSFTWIKFDIILMGLKIPTWYNHCNTLVHPYFMP